MDHLRRCLTTEIEPIDRAGLLYTAMHVETFSEALEKYGLGHGSKKNLHQILKRFNDMASVKSDYFVSKKDDMMTISKYLDSVDLSIVSNVTIVSEADEWGSRKQWLVCYVYQSNVFCILILLFCQYPPYFRPTNTYFAWLL